MASAVGKLDGDLRVARATSVAQRAKIPTPTSKYLRTADRDRRHATVAQLTDRRRRRRRSTPQDNEVVELVLRSHETAGPGCSVAAPGRKHVQNERPGPPLKL